jgi:uridine kinase
MAIIKPFVIGAAGGSGSGKTTIITEITRKLNDIEITTLQHDAYYKNNDRLSLAEREQINYDHPDSLDTDLLIFHLKELIAGREITMPEYDFKIHSRKKEGIIKKPARLIILEGILIFVEKELRDLMDVRIFVDADDDIRFIRRLNRDVSERGRSLESVIKQYLSTVKPMHAAYVLPSRQYADIIIPEGDTTGFTNALIDLIKRFINEGKRIR